ncbi:hypothetical protein DFH11DRAFT_1512097 [Phellopilus nigrolimitatus]|nr:hypothetical protein DFH11DRAFT_1512097 [Phellopilus nigrolimitatus]
MAESGTIKTQEPQDVDVKMFFEVDIKPKRLPSQSPVLKSESSSATPPPASKPVSKAKSGTPVPAHNGKPGTQLIGHLPRAEEDALKTFQELQSNHYQYSTLGRSREALESMTCDCQFVPGEDEPDSACGERSDCINRLTQVECLEDDCRCRAYCKNQRMQRRQYANIEVVLTEKKGYGLRAGSDIRKDSFIYEYIGDVVSQPSFVKRMRDYADEGIRHFYFMMLQKDEYIDATKRGGIGRFANHSCNPNCYVAKWTVGNRVRMGIYAKRSIKKDEELTFNYNVDRYGHDAQPCYCGEPNCVGVLGGKTQTDVGGMDDLYLDALGITEEVEMGGLKGNKKRKGKKLDEDYVPILKPLVEKDIPKVVQAIRQTQSRKVLLKLLARIKMTEDQSALRQLMRLRGFSLMCNILEDNLTDIDICLTVLECTRAWPLLQRNKVEDSKIEEPVRILAQSENEPLRTLAAKLLRSWDVLQVGYRIPKRQKADEDEDNSPVTPEVFNFEDETRNVKRNRKGDISDLVEVDPSMFSHLRPLGRTAQSYTAEANRFSGFNDKQLEEEEEKRRGKQAQAPSRKEIADVIAAAARATEEAKKAEEERAAAAKAVAEAEAAKKSKRSKDKSKKKELSLEEKEKRKSKKLMKLVGTVVVTYLSKYRYQMDHEVFKKHAKQLTLIVLEKEKKSNSYQSGHLDSLSDEKVAKIKKFSKDYITKLLRRIEKSGPSKLPHGSGSKASTSTPNTNASVEPEANLEDTLDFDGNDDDEADDDVNDSGDPSPASEVNGPEPAVAVVGRDVEMDTEMDSTASRRDSSFVKPPSSVKSKRSRWDQGPAPAVPVSASGSSLCTDL